MWQVEIRREGDRLFANEFPLLHAKEGEEIDPYTNIEQGGFMGICFSPEDNKVIAIAHSRCLSALVERLSGSFDGTIDRLRSEGKPIVEPDCKIYRFIFMEDYPLIEAPLVE